MRFNIVGLLNDTIRVTAKRVRRPLARTACPPRRRPRRRPACLPPCIGPVFAA